MTATEEEYMSVLDQAIYYITAATAVCVYNSLGQCDDRRYICLYYYDVKQSEGEDNNNNNKNNNNKPSL